MTEAKKNVLPPAPTNEKKSLGGNVVWALFVIFLGVVFLLNNLDILPWTVWLSLWRFWPLLLILWGIQLILGGSWAAATAIVVLSLLTFGLVIALMLGTTVPDFNDRIMRFAPWWNDFRTGITQEEEQTKQITIEAAAYPAAKGRNLDAALGWGSLTLTDDETTNLFAVNAIYFGGDGEPQVESNIDDDGTLQLDFTASRENWFPHFNLKNQTYELTLGQTALPTRLALDLGAGEGTITLTQLKTGEINAKVGAGQLTLDLAEAALPTAGLKLEVGAGTTVLKLPATAGFKVIYEVGVGDFRVNGDPVTSGLSEEGTYTSANYDTAPTKLEIELKVGAGSIVIRTQ